MEHHPCQDAHENWYGDTAHAHLATLLLFRAPFVLHHAVSNFIYVTRQSVELPAVPVMANFYHDSSRRDVFAGRARSLAPLSGPEMCQIDLLEWIPGIGSHPRFQR